MVCLMHDPETNGSHHHSIAFGKTIWLVLKKDLQLELRTRVRFTSVFSFLLLALFLFSFAAGADTPLLSKFAAGFVWLALLFSSTLNLTESFRLEFETAALEGLRLQGLSTPAIFFGKALGNTLFLYAMGLLLLPLSVALFDYHIHGSWALGACILLLGTGAISAPGTLYAALTGQARGRDVLLPLLLFPILVPALLASVKAMHLLFHGDPAEQMDLWMMLLALFNLLYWPLCSMLFKNIVEP